jgi:hypothetical protein
VAAAAEQQTISQDRAAQAQQGKVAQAVRAIIFMMVFLMNFQTAAAVAVQAMRAARAPH